MENPSGLVVFSEVQQEAFGRALMAIAEKVYNKPKNSLVSQDEATDDEDSTSTDCEVLGVFYTDTTDLNGHDEKTESFKISSDVICKYVEPEKELNQENVGNALVTNDDSRKENSIIDDIDIIELDDDDDADDNTGDADDDDDDGNGDDMPIETDLNEREMNIQSFTNPRLGEYGMYVAYSCPKCGVSCKSYKNWKAHTDIVHHFRRIDELNMRTIVNRKGETSYQCRSCQEQFAAGIYYCNLLQHRITHMPYPDYVKCRLCEQTFKAHSYFTKHLKTRHTDLVGLRVNSKSFTCHVRYHCPVCNIVAADRLKWLEHLEDNHEWNKRIPQTLNIKGKNLAECKICTAKFSSKQMWKHPFKHEKYAAFHCKLCDVYSSWAIANCINHMRKIHFVDHKRLHCGYCDLNFKDDRSRKKHLIEKHVIERVHCEFCKKTFLNSAYLLRHMRLTNHQQLK